MPKETKWTPEYIRYIQQIINMSNPVSLSTNVSNEESSPTELGELIEDEYSPSPDDIVIEQDRKNLVHKYINKYLGEREREIIKLRFGFDDDTPRSLEEIGERFNLSRERVRQIEAKALRKLRTRFAQNKIREENL